MLFASENWRPFLVFFLTFGAVSEFEFRFSYHLQPKKGARLGKGGHLTKVHASSSPLRVGVVSPRAAVGSYNSLLRTLLYSNLKKKEINKNKRKKINKIS